MEDVSNLPFRLLCKKYGAAMAYTQQISAVALIRNNLKSLSFAVTSPKDCPVGLQLFGRNPDVLVEAAKKVGANFDVIDLNFGCPSKKVVAQGYGSALLKEKDRIHKIIAVLVKHCNKPITVKMRSGFKQVEAVKLVKVMEDAGAAAITLHARTQAQKYSGKADWGIIKEAKDVVSIPIIGNGDVTSPESAKELLDSTGCDFIMIGRAAMNNPLIFRDILHFFKTGKIIETSKEEKIGLIFEYFSLDPSGSLPKWKMVAQHFTKGIPGSPSLRDKLTKAASKEAMEQLLQEFKEK